MRTAFMALLASGDALGQQSMLTVDVEDATGARVPGAAIVLRCVGARDEEREADPEPHEESRRGRHAGETTTCLTSAM